MTFTEERKKNIKCVTDTLSENEVIRKSQNASAHRHHKETDRVSPSVHSYY
jgi:hypothetical protein